MKYLSVFLFVFLMSCNAQSQSIEVVYGETRDLTQKAQGVDNAQVQAILSSLSKEETLYTLQFSEGRSLYAKKKSEGSGEGSGFNVINVSGGDYQLYKDQKTKKTVEQKNILNRTFKMEEDLVAIDWTVEDGTAEVAGYKVTKAVTKDAEGKEIMAWFTEDVPVNDGPLHYWGLPGLILKMTIGDKTIEAKSLEMKKEKLNITPPEKGELVSRAEYEEIEAKKKESFMSGFGGAGNVIKIDKNK